MTTRALYTPGRDVLPDGNAMPTGRGDAARAEYDEIRDAVITDTPQPLSMTTPDYDAMIAERLRTITLGERILVEIALSERRSFSFTSDYDPLRY